MHPAKQVFENKEGKDLKKGAKLKSNERPAKWNYFSYIQMSKKEHLVLGFVDKTDIKKVKGCLNGKEAVDDLLG